MKAAVIDGVPGLPSLIDVSVYDTKPVHFLLMCCNAIRWFQKTRQVYDSKIEMLVDAHFLRLNVNNS